MKLFTILKNQRGALFLAVLVIMAVGAPVLYTMGRYMEHRRADIKNVEDKLARGENITDAEFTRAQTAVADTARVLQAGGGVLNSVSNIGAPGVKDAVAVIADTATGEIVSRATNPPPTASNDPLPSDIHSPGTCSGTNLAGCSSRSTCVAAGGNWRTNNTCSSTAEVGCSGANITECRTSANCTAAGGFWYGNKCNALPEPLCSSSRLDLCTSSGPCLTAGGYWYDGACNATPPTCSRTTLNLCLNSTDCTNVGGYWYSNICNSEPQPQCDNLNLNLCTTSGECSSAGGYWYDNRCNLSPESCYSSNVTTCATESDCFNAGGYWYNNQCNAQPEMDCGAGGVFNCANGTQICANLACNTQNNCGDNSDELNCGSGSSCCVMTNGCPSETANDCAATCCCCPYGQVCDRANPANGCVSAY